MTETLNMSKRDLLRSTIFSTKQPKSKVIEFFGAQIELRQPLLGEIIDAQTEENRQKALTDVLVRQAFIPGTDEHIFEDADHDGLRQLPFGADFVRLSEAIQELSEVNFLDKKGT